MAYVCIGTFFVEPLEFVLRCDQRKKGRYFKGTKTVINDFIHVENVVIAGKSITLEKIMLFIICSMKCFQSWHLKRIISE